MEAIAAADARFAEVLAAVEARRQVGEDILLIACSDHGHQTVQAVVDIESELVTAGLKRDLADTGIVSVSNGTSALVYVHPERSFQADALIEFLVAQPWAGSVHVGPALGDIGQAASDSLCCAISMASDPAPNVYGVSGLAYAAKPSAGKPDRLGCGQHGGLGAAEQMPFLMINGGEFIAGANQVAPSSPIDLAPTILRHLGLDAEGCDGRPLQGRAGGF
jgi:arylsulfatase A-like enzyme